MRHYAIRQRTREVMEEVAILIRAMKSSAYDTGRALQQARDSVAALTGKGLQ